MKIRLGVNLSPSTIDENFGKPLLGFQNLNPGGFLGFLEKKLGLQKPEVHSFERVSEWVGLLDQQKSGQFYEASFENDPIAVAKDLLSRRDELKLCGWKGEPIKGFQMIEVLSTLEALSKFRTGVPDRLLAIIESLESDRAPFLQELEIIPCPEFEQKLWRDLLAILKKHGVEIQQWSGELVKSGVADLSALKSALTGRNKDLPKQDGSVSILTGKCPAESAAHLARWLKAKTLEELSSMALIVPPNYRHLLARSLTDHGVVFSGSSQTSEISRPSTQILVMALELLWQPVDPQAALSLLQLPINPFPSSVRNSLTEALTSVPSTQSQTWKKTLDEIEKAYREKYTDVQAERILEKIDKWFNPSTALNATTIEKEQITEACDRVMEFAKPRIKDHDSMRQTVVMAQTLKRFVESWPQSEVSKESLMKILKEALGEGSAFSELPAWAGGAIVVNHPGDIIAQVESVVWWDATASAAELSFTSRWLMSEKETLKNNGIFLPTQEDVSSAAVGEWKKPLAFVKNELMFVTFENSEDGEKEYLHPIFDQVFNPEKMELWLSSLTIDVEKASNNVTKRFFAQVGVEVREKPEAKDKLSGLDWRSSEITINPRKSESASSLKTLFGCSLKYALEYGARLKKTNVPSTKDLAAFVGTFLHSVMEEVFIEGPAPDPNDAEIKANDTFTSLVKKELPILLMPGNEVLYENTKNSIARSARVYAEYLHANDLEIVGAEVQKERELMSGLKINGRADQILGKDGKALVIIDFKKRVWDVMLEDMEKGVAIQPAIYSWLHTSDRYPDMGYFDLIRSEASVAGTYTQSARSIADSQSVPQIMERVKEEATSRQGELNSGEMQASGHLEENDQGDFKAPCNFCDFDGICGIRWGNNES